MLGGSEPFSTVSRRCQTVLRFNHQLVKDLWLSLLIAEDKDAAHIVADIFALANCKL